jgi:hypothetical protein
MSNEAKAKIEAPATLPVVAPVSRSKALPFMDEVRRLLTGEGGTVAQLCAALKLSDKDARGVIDAIRRKEGYNALPLVAKRFVYKGADGKGYSAPKGK